MNSMVTKFSEFYLIVMCYFIFFSYLEDKYLIHNVSVVCAAWRNIVHHPELWIMKCERKGIPHIRASSLWKQNNVIDWQTYAKISMKNPFGRNLIKMSSPPNRYDYYELSDWTIKQNSGDQWRVERPPSGSDDLLNIPELAESNCCFATSYGPCVKEQCICLLQEGLTERYLDEMQPDITVKEYYAGRFDCGCIYKLEVSLLAENQSVIDSFTFDWREEQWLGKEWHKVVHVFTQYGPGLRYVKFCHSGQDTQFWAGHYGSKMAGASVTLAST